MRLLLVAAFIVAFAAFVIAEDDEDQSAQNDLYQRRAERSNHYFRTLRSGNGNNEHFSMRSGNGNGINEHFFRTLKRKARNNDHYFRTLKKKRAEQFQTPMTARRRYSNHYFRSLRRQQQDTNHYFRSLKRKRNSAKRIAAANAISQILAPDLKTALQLEEDKQNGGVDGEALRRAICATL